MEKKKKKPSKTALIKHLREEIKRLHEVCERRWRKINDLEDEIIYFKTIMPKKFFKIQFKIKAKCENVFTFTEIHEGYTAQHAIEVLKRDKIYPDSFKLVGIKLLA